MALGKCLMAWVGILGVGVTSVWGAEYPSKPVRIVVPYVPGGSTDILARMIGQRLSEAWGQQFIIDNRPGAGGNIGSGIVAKSPADGYALVMATNGTHAINPSLYANMPYDAVNDFAPVILVAQVPLLLVVHPSLPVKNVRDLITLAKAHPGTLTFGSASTGSSGHLAGEMLKTVAGINTIHVPYKGDAPAVADLMGGQISFLFANMPAAVQYVRSDRLRGIAVTTPRRSPAVPDIPTMIESGIAGFEVVPWYGILGPAGMPATVISHLDTEIERILKLPDVKERMASLGAEAVGGTPEQFAAQIKSDIAKYAKAVRASGAKVN